jgi:hypothetical protein
MPPGVDAPCAAAAHREQGCGPLWQRGPPPSCVSPEADHRVLPPNGRDYPTFQTIIVGKNNADPYPDHAPRSTR